MNQDRLGANGTLFVLCDGMGGTPSGHVAATMCVRTMYSRSPATDLDLVDAVRAASRQCTALGSRFGDLAGTGTTVAAVLITPSGPVHLTWVGDTRIYRLRRGRLQQLSVDDTPLGRKLAKPSEIRADIANQLLSYIGAVDCEPSHLTIDGLPGDRFVLCTDGVWRVLTKLRLEELSDQEQISDVVAALVAEAVGNGATDDASALVVDLQMESTDFTLTIVEQAMPSLNIGGDARQGEIPPRDDYRRPVAKDLKKGPLASRYVADASRRSLRMTIEAVPE